MMYATVNAGHDSFQARREGLVPFSILSRRRPHPCVYTGYFVNWKGTQNLGADGLGEVVAVGTNVESLQEGDYVTCCFCRSFSEYTSAKESVCVKIPSPEPEYTALRVAGTYACGFLEHTEPIRAGDTLLVTAACGGVGHIAAQIGKLRGCHVIGTCGSAAKKEKLIELGLDRVVDYTREVRRRERLGGDGRFCSLLSRSWNLSIHVDWTTLWMAWEALCGRLPLSI